MSVEKHRYNACLANYFSVRLLFFDGDLQKKPNVRKCVEQPFQQTKAELWDELTETLCNLNFIQAKAVAKMTYNLVDDFNAVLQVIPDNAGNVSKEKARQARIDKFTHNLIACAKSECTILQLEIPESINPLPIHIIECEIERKKTTPLRLDKLNDFYYFLGQEAENLQEYATIFKNLAIQQAWNYANSGPVVKTAEESLPNRILCDLLLRKKDNRPVWNPSNPIIRILGNHDNGINCIEATPDFKLALTGSQIGQSWYLWNLELGKLINKCYTEGKLNDLCMSADGKLAITCSDECILWSLETGKQLKTLNNPLSKKTQHYLSPRKNKLLRLLIKRPKIEKEKYLQY